MDISEVLLYLDLMKKAKRRPDLDELKMMLYYLDNYDQVKEFNDKLFELKFFPPNKFIASSLIHFIEDYQISIELKNWILLQKSKRNYQSLFIHLICLCKTEEEALNIINEAKKHGVKLDESWVSIFDSFYRIKNSQIEWKKIQKSKFYDRFPQMYEDFCKMKTNYFNSISPKQLIENLLEKEPNTYDTQKTVQTSVYYRSIYIKEFARIVANGICQLCDNEAPFLDKQGNPFLEVHHIHYLSKGGTDTIDNVVAICPNCHRKVHQLELEEDVKKLKDKAQENLEV
jgi:predicted HNH restriction endonuclease